MKIIRPLAIDDAIFNSSNMAENDHNVWDVGTSYSLGDRVIVISTHSIYESALAGANTNTGNDPTTDTDGTNWIKVGATNKWKPFDNTLNDKATNASSMTFSLVPSALVNALAAFEVSADSVQIVVTDPTDGIVYDTTLNLNDNTNVTDWYTYFYEPIVSASEFLLTNLPAYSAATIDVTYTVASGNVQLGEMVLGQMQTLAVSLYNSRVGIQDYSRKDRDAFGNANIVQRAFNDLLDLSFVLDTNKVRTLQRSLSSLRATPVVWFGIEDTSVATLVYGYYRDFNINLSNHNKSFGSITIEGLV